MPISTLTNVICSTPQCDKTVRARGLCSACYMKAKRHGNFVPGEQTIKWQHRLTNVDEVNKTATCSTCGIVKVFPRERKSGWKCSLLSKANKRFHDKRKRKIKNAGLLDHCEICGSKDNLRWDHDHITGLFRGTLCNNCNLAIGHLRDNPESCINASKYLKRNKNDSQSSSL